MHEEDKVPIWLFIGMLLLIYGIVITVTGLYQWAFPPALALRVQLWNLHADVWWGILMIAVGTLYCVKFPPPKTT